MRYKDVVRRHSWCWLAWTAVLALSPVSEAGVFRIDCIAHRHAYPAMNNQHYGYFPTCWHPWPGGWNNCPIYTHGPVTHAAPVPASASETLIPVMPKTVPAQGPHP